MFKKLIDHEWQVIWYSLLFCGACEPSREGGHPFMRGASCYTLHSAPGSAKHVAGCSEEMQNCRMLNREAIVFKVTDHA